MMDDDNYTSRGVLFGDKDTKNGFLYFLFHISIYLLHKAYVGIRIIFDG